MSTLFGLWPMAHGKSRYDDDSDSYARSRLRDEGSIQVAPLPEIKDSSVEMIPLVPERRLKRLQKLWDEMDASMRAQAFRKHSLPLLSSDGLSTARLEELIWKRMRIPTEPTDLATVLYRLMKGWPNDADAAGLHAGTLVDTLLKTGRLPSSTD